MLEAKGPINMKTQQNKVLGLRSSNVQALVHNLAA
jgi:hypothetical protein